LVYPRGLDTILSGSRIERGSDACRPDCCGSSVHSCDQRFPLGTGANHGDRGVGADLVVKGVCLVQFDHGVHRKPTCDELAQLGTVLVEHPPVGTDIRANAIWLELL